MAVMAGPAAGVVAEVEALRELSGRAVAWPVVALPQDGRAAALAVVVLIMARKGWPALADPGGAEGGPPKGAPPPTR